MRIKLTLFIFITIIAFGFSCGKSDKTYTIKMKDGVNYVHNRAPLWDDEPKVALEFVQMIGVLDTEDEHYQLYRPTCIALDQARNIYVLENGNARIQKYDAEGHYIRTIGRRGQGPGEFDFPVWLEIDADGNLYVGEGGRRLIIVLNPDGEEKTRIRLPGMFDYFHITPEKRIAMHSPAGFEYRPEIQKDRLITVFDLDVSLLHYFGEPHVYKNTQLTRLGNDFYMCIGRECEMFTAFVEQNRIEKYTSDGTLEMVVDRPLNYKTGHRMVIHTYPPEFEIEPREMPEFNRVAAGIACDHKDRLWVMTYKKQREENDEPADYLVYEVFSPDGVLLGYLPCEYRGTMQIFDDRLFMTDGVNQMGVFEYKIVEK